MMKGSNGMLVDKKVIKASYLFIAIMIICMTFWSDINVYASVDESRSVPVTYVKNESTAYPLTLEVIGKGSVFDGKKTVKNSTEKYLVKIDETIKFKINPDDGAKVSKILLDDKNIEGKIENNEIVINGQEKEQKLLVEFVGDIDSMPKTGDSNNIEFYCFILILSIIGFVLLNRKDKQRG
ncbi:hypothetical protein QJR26_15845 [Clostridium baratii]